MMFAALSLCSISFAFADKTNHRHPAPSHRAIVFTRGSQGEWEGPWADLRNVGADMNQRSFTTTAEATLQHLLFPLGASLSPSDLEKKAGLVAKHSAGDKTLVAHKERGLRSNQDQDDAKGRSNTSRVLQLEIFANIGQTVINFVVKVLDFILFEFLRSPSCDRQCLGWCSCDGFTCDRSDVFRLGRCTAPPTDDDARQCKAQAAPYPYECPPCMQKGKFQVEVSGYCDTFMTCGVPIATGDCEKATQQCMYWSDHKSSEDSRLCPPEGTHYYCTSYVAERAGSCGKDRRGLQGEDSIASTEHNDYEDEEVDQRYALNRTEDWHSVTLGFIRIPKTGSTTALKFLERTRTMHAWDRHVDMSGLDTGNGSNIAGCMLAPTPNQKLLINSRKRAFWNRCPHVPLGKMVEFWGKTIPHWSSPPTLVSRKAPPQTGGHALLKPEKTTPMPVNTPVTMSFEGFTMVRDPFDRLVSYFYYLRKFVDNSEFLKHTCTEAQYEAVKANELWTYLELLHTEGGGRGLEMPWQYKDVRVAIALIRNDASPGVLALLTECYEASLHLLTETMCCFPPGSVESIVKSDEFKSNSNSNPEGKAGHAALAALRSKAQVWFEDDFEFYSAVVDEFLRKVESSSLDPSVLERCMLTSDHSRPRNLDN